MKVVWIMGLSCSCIIIFVKLMDDYPPCNIFLKKEEEEKSVHFARDMVLEVHIDGNTEKKRKSKNTKIDRRIGHNPLTLKRRKESFRWICSEVWPTTHGDIANHPGYTS
ncbi:unnamed protein product [Camellia sinensis]